MFGDQMDHPVPFLRKLAKSVCLVRADTLGQDGAHHQGRGDDDDGRERVLRHRDIRVDWQRVTYAKPACKAQGAN